MMKRLGNIGINIARGAATPLYSVLLSALVVRSSEAELWGKFVQSLILIGLAAQVLNWGYRDYLLRRFAATPAKINQLFISNLFTRALLLPFLFLLLWLFADTNTEWLWLCLWLLFYFLYLSYEVLIVYKRAFFHQLIADTLGFALPVSALFIFNLTPLSSSSLMQWFVAGMGVKWLFLSIVFRKELCFNLLPRIHSRFFTKALPFFLIGLNGMLLSKADLYITSLYASANDLGKYQVGMTFFVYLQALAGFTTSPFLKSMFRLNQTSYDQLSKSLRWFGLVACLVGTPLIYLLVKQLYGFSLPIGLFILGGIASFPVFYYAPDIIMLYRNQKERNIMWINLAAALLSGIATWLLFPKMNIQAGFVAVAITQWALLFYYTWQKSTIVSVYPEKNKQ